MAAVLAGAQQQNPAEPDLDIGIGVLRLLLRGSEWIRRRVETFEFTSVRTVRRQVSTDLRLPRPGEQSRHLPEEDLAALLAHPPPLVPVLTLEKRKLTNLDFWDEDGRRLPFLTTDQNGRLSGDALAAAAGLAALRYGFGGLKQPFVDALLGIATLPVYLAEPLRVSLTGDPRRQRREAEELAQPTRPDDPSADARHEFQRIHEALCPEYDTVGARARIHSIFEDATVKSLATQLAGNFVVYIPLLGDPYERRLVKLAYDEQIGATRPASEQRLARRAFTGLATRCAWQSKQYGLSRVRVGDAESHHLEFIAPDGTKIDGGFFTAAWRRGQDGRQVRSDRYDGSNETRAHLYLRDLPVDASATGGIRVKADPAGTVNAGVLVCLLVTFALWFGSFHLKTAGREAAAAVLLALPSLLAVYVARFEEHPLLAHLLSGVRAMIYSAGFFVFFAAATLAFGLGGGLHCVWVWLRWISLAPLAGLLIARFRLRRGNPVNAKNVP